MCNQLDLQTIRSQSIMPKISPITGSEGFHVNQLSFTSKSGAKKCLGLLVGGPRESSVRSHLLVAVNMRTPFFAAHPPVGVGRV